MKQIEEKGRRQQTVVRVMWLVAWERRKVNSSDPDTGGICEENASKTNLDFCNWKYIVTSSLTQGRKKCKLSEVMVLWIGYPRESCSNCVVRVNM